MYFHTEEKGIFFLDRGKFQRTYPFNTVSRGIQSLIENSLPLAPEVLSSMKFHNVFFNYGENDEVSKDRMLILFELPITSEMN